MHLNLLSFNMCSKQNLDKESIVFYNQNVLREYINTSIPLQK